MDNKEDKIKYYEKLLLSAREFIIDASGSWETSQGDYLLEEIDKLNLKKEK